MYDMLVLGDYFFDMIYVGLPEFPSLGREIYSTSMITTGGGMFITAAALRRLGANVGWRAQFGSDPYSVHVRDLAQAEGIDLALSRTFDTPYRRVTTSLPIHGERAFATFADPDPADIFAFWQDAVENTNYKHLHLSLMPPELCAPLLQTARKRGATISMDCHDAPSLWDGCDWQRLLGMIDIFMANAREAQLITKRDRMDKIVQKLNRWANKVVIKDGACGAWIGDARRDDPVHVPCIDAGAVIDTTGAGDCFNAGFLYAAVVEGLDDEMCGRYGNICGGLSVTGIGGATHAPTHEALQYWLTHYTPSETIKLG